MYLHTFELDSFAHAPARGDMATSVTSSTQPSELRSHLPFPPSSFMYRLGFTLISILALRRSQAKGKSTFFVYLCFVLLAYVEGKIRAMRNSPSTLFSPSRIRRKIHIKNRMTSQLAPSFNGIIEANKRWRFDYRRKLITPQTRSQRTVDKIG